MTVKGKDEYLTKCVTFTVERSIKDAAERKRDGDLLCKIIDGDLIITLAEKSIQEYVKANNNVHHTILALDAPIKML